MKQLEVSLDVLVGCVYVEEALDFEDQVELLVFGGEAADESGVEGLPGSSLVFYAPGVKPRGCIQMQINGGGDKLVVLGDVKQTMMGGHHVDLIVKISH